MSVQNITRRAGPYVGTGLVSAYTFAFKVFRSEDVKVVRSESADASAQDEVLKFGTDYTVKLNANQDEKAGGTVTLVSPLAEGLRLSILSAITPDQQMVLTNHDGMLPTTLNDSADKAIALIQELKEEVGRTLRVPASSDKTPEDLTEELLSAQNDARKYADAAQQSAEEAKKSELKTAEYAEAATVIVPFKDEIKTVADNIVDVTAVGQSIQSVNNVASVKTEVVEVAAVAGDVSIVAQKADAVATVADGMPHVEIVAKDLVGEVIGDGDYDCGSTTDSPIPDVEVVDGNIHTVAINIEDVNKIADAIDRGDLETAVNAIETTTENVRLSEAAKKGAEAAKVSALEAQAGAKSAKTGADASNALAKKWATQTTAPVDGDLYGAKYYADRAAQSESSTGGLLQEVKDETAAGVKSIQTEGGSQIASVQAAGSSAVQTVTQEGGTQVAAVVAEGQKQVKAVEAAGATQADTVNSAGTSWKTAIDEAGTSWEAKVNTAGETHTKAVNDAGTSWQGKVNAAGISWEKKVNDAGGTQVGAVNAAGAVQVKAVETAGSTQTANAKAQADAAAASATAAANAQKAAETAKTGAETAKTGADSAKAAAVAAQGKAETAANTATVKATEVGAQASAAAKSAQAAAESAKTSAYAMRLTSVNLSASGTAALSSLTPQTNIKVGDTVIDPDGEVFAIASLTGTTFTVGAKLTSLKGPQGLKGDTGAPLSIKGSFPTLDELQEQHPVGQLGDAYMVGAHLYSWNGSAWQDVGDIKGPKGDQGPAGPAGTTTWAGITGKPTLGALSAKDKITLADFDGDIDLGSTT